MNHELPIYNTFGRKIEPCRPWLAGEPCEIFLTALLNAVSVLHPDQTRVTQAVEQISREIAAAHGYGLEVLEKNLKALLAALIPGCGTAIEEQLTERTNLIVKQISKFLPTTASAVVDWGCGNGAVGARIAQSYSVFLVDVKDHRTTGYNLPYFIYDEETPVPSLPKDVGALLLLTVLHHAKDPLRTLKHALLTAPQRIIVIESVPDLPQTFFDSCRDNSEDYAFQYCAFVDWFYNRVICTAVQMTYNYQYVKDWIKTFSNLGYSLVEHVPLGIDQPLVPEWHALLVFEREA